MQWSAEFDWGGLTGNVHVECIPNDNPEAYGCWWPNAHGYPVCTARVEYPGRGYPAMFGWVQLVRSTDNDSSGEQFEVDPFALFGDAPSPYCWFGIEPTLFDAPSRPDRPPSEWVAHSFLGTTPMAEVMDGKPRASCRCSALRGGSTSAPGPSNCETSLNSPQPIGTPISRRCARAIRAGPSRNTRRSENRYGEYRSAARCG